MNLAVDIGNSFTHFAVFDGGKIAFSWKFPTSGQTPEMFLKGILPYIKNRLSGAGIASVVTEKNKKWVSALKSVFDVKTVIINNKIKLPVKLKVKNPGKLGADRICNASAGYEYFNRKENVIAADFGTATTIDIILKNGDFIGGIISPGISTMAKSLNDYTAKLPLLKKEDYKMPKFIIGPDTIGAIRSGTLYAALASFEGIVRKIETEKTARFKIIVTGGFSRYIHTSTRLKTIIRMNLVLEGINAILELNNGN